MELKQLPITLVMVVRNSNGRLKDVIKAHRDIVSEVVVVDQSSDDGTYEEALEHADFVFKRTNKGRCEPDRNFAFTTGSHDWVLNLDDDEYLDDKTKERLSEYLASGADIVWFNRRNYVDKKDLSDVIGNDPQCRLFRRGTLNWPDAMHRYPEPRQGAQVYFSDGWINHYRTLEGLKSANRKRNRVASPQEIQLQEQFISNVESALKQRVNFNEDWYKDDQIEKLVTQFNRVKGLEGDIVEIGCWEGKSTCALANVVHPETLIAVDSWNGDSDDHVTRKILKERDVFNQFIKNIGELTKRNVDVHKRDCFEFLSEYSGKIKFIHIDAAHDYDSVKRTIEMVKDKVVSGGIICGDDFVASHESHPNMNGGVERAVKESLPGFKNDYNFWYWVKD